MSAAARPASRLANSPASGGGFDRPQMAIIIGLEWRLPPACALRRAICCTQVGLRGRVTAWWRDIAWNNALWYVGPQAASFADLPAYD